MSKTFVSQYAFIDPNSKLLLSNFLMNFSLKNKLVTLEDYLQKAKLLEKENINDAIIVCREAIEVYPNVQSLYDQLGKLLIKSQAFKEAIQCYQQAMSLNSQWFRPYFALGEIAAQQNQLELAISHYKQAISLQPNFFWTYFHLGKLFQQQGELEEARAIYEAMLKINPNFPQGYRHLGLTYATEEKWDEAIKYLLKALYIEPSFLAALHSIKQILDKKNKSTNRDAYHKTKDIPLDLIKKYMPSTREWSVVNKPSSVEDFKHLDIYPTSQNSLLPPKSIHRELAEPFCATEVKFVSKHLVLVDNGRAWADKWRSAVITQNHQLLAHISTGYANPIVASDNLPSPYIIEGKVAFLSSRWGSKAYFHWMLETLPRIELLRQSRIDFSSIDKFCLYECNARFNHETLNILGIPSVKIIDSTEYPYIQARKLIVPSIMFGSSRFSPWVIDFLRKEFLSHQVCQSDYPKRIYISRKSKRRIINEAEVEDLLAKYGFKSVTLESMSVVEQASLMAAAEVVIAPHGAGLTNIVFCRPRTTIIEIFSPKYINTCYWYLSNSCNLEYYYLVGENLYDQNKHDGAQDMIVDLQSLSQTLILSGI